MKKIRFKYCVKITESIIIGYEKTLSNIQKTLFCLRVLRDLLGDFLRHIPLWQLNFCRFFSFNRFSTS
ncbi:MAG: hypothetical protein VX579_06580, partial [Nitrospinota bacterium]|nr:hypothetical protein [Nitrospinota bacterium]